MYVKMGMARRQYAWLKNKRLFSNHQRLNGEHLYKKKKLIEFEEWLVGFTDGDGNFHITKQKVGDNIKWNLSFKLTQSAYNARVLNYIKKELGVGSITKDGKKLQFFIRDIKYIESVLIPIFDKYSLLTTKYFDYIKFKKALYILNDTEVSKKYKDIEIQKLKDSKPPVNYIYPA
jgi:LAGLIDADG endonuclease